VVGGVRFYERAEVKDALAYLRLVLNPADGAALRRIVNRPARGIGRTTLERAEALAEREHSTLLEGLRSYAASPAGSRAAPRVRRFLELLDQLATDVRGASPARAIACVIERTGYLAALEREGGPEAEARIENLRELMAAADDFARANAEVTDEERSDVEFFLDQVALVSDVDEYDRRDTVVSLMTVHSAKGLEFPIVFIVGLEEGIFPHVGASRDPEGVEEERRLCYVGMTRAMESLTLTCASQRLRFGSRTHGVPSRFLQEIPASVVESVGAPSRGRQMRAATGGGPAYDYSYAQAEPGEAVEVAPGLRVRHPHFGSGVVLSVAGDGPSQKLKIRFERAGVKTILVKYANLELE
jgi:DNA helicase-2/ATP-dependent DNA helicase PcrA